MSLQNKDTRAVVLCAGAGVRIMAVTKGLPKSFLKVGEETLIGRQIRLLRQCGITDVTLVVGYEADLFRRTFADCQFVSNAQYRTTNTAQSLLLALDPGETRTVLVLNGDVFFGDDVLSLIASHESETAAGVSRRRCGEEEVKVFVEGDRVTAIGKYLDDRQCAGEAFGVYKLGPRFARYLYRELRLGNNPGLFYEFAMDVLLRGGHDMRAVDIGSATAIEIDTESDYNEALARCAGR